MRFAALGRDVKPYALERLPQMHTIEMARAGSGQKLQKNFRLTQTCINLLDRLASLKGITDANMIEILVREEAERKDLNRFENKKTTGH
jgi:hypothetical protein